MIVKLWNFPPPIPKTANDERLVLFQVLNMRRTVKANNERWRWAWTSMKQLEMCYLLCFFFVRFTSVFQIVSDPRVRAERALREAGLQHSQYARDVLSVIKPPKPQRRDTATTLKF